MNRISALALCAVLAFPFASFAQDASTENAATMTEPAGAATETSSTVDWEAFDESLQAFAAADINFTAESSIEIVDLSAVTDEAEDTRDEYTVSIPANPEHIGAVREVIAGNSVVVDAIEGAGFSVDDVSNLWVNQEGTVTIFVDGADTGEAANPA